MALVGVLLHASLLVRHNAALIDAAFDQIALVASGGVICHSDASVGQSADSPALPKPFGKLPNCPICTGAAVAAAILPPTASLHLPALSAPARATVAHQRLASLQAEYRPPSRAPPELT